MFHSLIAVPPPLVINIVWRLLGQLSTRPDPACSSSAMCPSSARPLLLSSEHHTCLHDAWFPEDKCWSTEVRTAQWPANLLWHIFVATCGRPAWRSTLFMWSIQETSWAKWSILVQHPSRDFSWATVTVHVSAAYIRTHSTVETKRLRLIMSHWDPWWAPGTDILEIFLHFEGLATVVAQDCVIVVLKDKTLVFFEFSWSLILPARPLQTQCPVFDMTPIHFVLHCVVL